MIVHPVTSWVTPADPMSGPQRSVGLVEALVVHYPGGDIPANVDMVAYLRANHHSYLTSRGYSLGYNWAIDFRGEVWEIRGDRYRCGANGSESWNIRADAVQIVVTGDAPANPAQVRTLIAFHAARQAAQGRPLALLGHRQVRSQTWPRLNAGPSWPTQCPGPGIWAQMQLGVFDLEPPPPPIPEESDVTKVVLLTVPARDGVGIVYRCTEPSGVKSWLRNGNAVSWLRQRLALANVPVEEITSSDPAVIEALGVLDESTRTALAAAGYVVDPWGIPV